MTAFLLELWLLIEGHGWPRVLWSGDLNRDGRADGILVISGTCGNWGECEMVVYASQPDGGLAVVLPLEYRYQLAVVPRADGWAELEETTRGGSALDDSPGRVRWRYRPASGRYEPVR